jgi:hypothetical protein
MIWNLVLPIVDKIVDLIPNKNKANELRNELQVTLLDAIAKSDAAQLEVNKVEAASQSLFVSGWRPAAGWLCVICLAYQMLIVPVLSAILITLGIYPDFPTLDKTQLDTLLYGMLGLGTLRTVDKIKAVK